MPARRPQQGFTILEVLFAIGIATIGLFGVLALIPLASMQSEQGLIADMQSAVGKNAFREFHIRGMSQQKNWVLANGNPVSINPSNPALFQPGAAFCIDPRYVARHGSTVFPDCATAAPVQMARITLKADPNMANGAANVMMIPQADQVFQAADDLVFEAQSDNTLPPLQEYTSGGTKRQSYGDISWMAVVTPKFGMVPAANQTSDMFNLAVVVFHQRYMIADRSIADPQRERIAVIKAANFYSQGVSGGDVRITSPNNVFEEVNVKRNDWVMLSQFITYTTPSGATVTSPTHKWYRVVAADPEVDTSNGVFERDVTLHGPDWNGTLDTQVTLVTGVVAVYEKSMRLETSSLWTNP